MGSFSPWSVGPVALGPVERQHIKAGARVGTSCSPDGGQEVVERGKEPVISQSFMGAPQIF